MSIYLEAANSRILEAVSLANLEEESPSFGCGDRAYWGWKFTDFPSSRFQEFVYTLSWLYAASESESKWSGSRVLLRAIEGGINKWCELQLKDGSFNEAYPNERSLAATAFTLFYLTEAFELVGEALSCETRGRFLESARCAAGWLTDNDETHGFLSNHLAVAGASCLNASLIFGESRFRERCDYFVSKILREQSSEGWYMEYGGADVGYQTHGVFYLARIWQKSNDPKLLDSLKRSNEFLRHFIHPDGTLGGDYASRNTRFYFPAGFEILSKVCSYAAAIANYQRERIAIGMSVGLNSVDAFNLFPMLNNYLFAHRSSKSCCDDGVFSDWVGEGRVYFPEAGWLKLATSRYYAVVGARKGGVLLVWDQPSRRCVFRSSGYVTYSRGRLYANHSGCLRGADTGEALVFESRWLRVNHRLFSPWLFVAFRVFNMTFGRFRVVARWLKNLLVKELVSNRQELSDAITRTIRFGDREILIEDSGNGEDRKVKHVNRFSSIHMGSSRYLHAEDLMDRLPEGVQVKKRTIDSGMIVKTSIKWNED